MRLISLELENFRQHAKSRIDFSDGITAIVGTNGSGKSTILEAISWAIYGTEAARGNKDSIKWNKAPARSKVRVELVFALDNETYRVVREFAKAEVYLESNANPLAITQDEVTKYLTEKLGMSRVEFFNTYFTGQKELSFLGSQKPVERRKFISKVLGYERVRLAQEKVRLDKNNLSNEILGIKQGLGDYEALESEKKQIKEEISLIEKDFNEKQLEFKKDSLELTEVEPAWEKIKGIKENFDKYKREGDFLDEKIAFLSKNIENLKTQSATLEEKSKKLQELASFENEYKQISEKIAEQEKFQEQENKKQKILIQIQSLEKEIVAKEVEIEEITRTGKEKRAILDKLPGIKEEINKLDEAVKKEENFWHAAKKEKEVLIKQKEIELEKVQKQLAIIEEKGEDGNCPTCERALKGEFDKVTGLFKKNIEDISKEISVLKQALYGLSAEPEMISKNRKLKEEKEKEYVSLNQFQGQYEEARKRWQLLHEEIKINNKELEGYKKALLEIPKGFDSELMKKLKEDIVPLREKYEEILKLKAETSSLENINKDIEAQNKELADIKNKHLEISKNLQALNYSQDEYLGLEKQISLVKDKFYRSKEELVKTESELNNYKDRLNRLIKLEESYKEKQELIKAKQNEVNHLIELDRFYTQFLEKLNNQARPEISEIAGKFLEELTDGRYSVLELNDKYEICLREDAQADIKPIISGGEEDIANLSVRIAISQMIAQRSGRSLSLLILDEVFGSLDETRRNNVISLLQSLTNNFDQVIVITHIDDIKEGLDNIIKVEFDEERGCSQVSMAENNISSAFEIEKELVDLNNI